MGYNACTAKQKPYISPVNVKKRLEFASKYQFAVETSWRDVIFADESQYNLFGSDGEGKGWCKPNTMLERKKLTASVKHGGSSVMCWGCFAASSVGALAFVEGNTNANMYVEILKTHLRPSTEKLGLLNAFWLYRDNDPKHKGYWTREWLLYNYPQVLDMLPQSPDCNPVENLWDFLDSKFCERPISNKKQLKE